MMSSPFIIAECGVNFRSIHELDLMIQESVCAGADAIKVQVYEPYFTKLDHPRACELNKIALKEEDIRYIYWRCMQYKTMFITTPMYPKAVEMCAPYVDMWKIRFADNNNWDIINKCMETDKDIFISCAPKPMKDLDKVKSLYCIPEYPPKHNANNFPYKWWEGFNGYSCHIPDLKHIIGAVKYGGLEYLEVHVKRDSYGDDSYSPIDNNVSITMSELKQLCKELA